MTWHFNFWNDGYLAFFRVSDNHFNVFLGIKSAVRFAIKLLRVVIIMTNQGFISISRNLLKFWVFFYFNAPTLIFGQMPMKCIHFEQCQRINIFFDEIDTLHMSAAIQMHSAIRKLWLVFNSLARNGDRIGFKTAIFKFYR